MQSLTPFFRFSTSMWNLYTYSYTLDTETPKKCQTNFFRKRKKCAPVQQQQKTRIKKTFSIFIYAISLLCVRSFVRSFIVCVLQCECAHVCVHGLNDEFRLGTNENLIDIVGMRKIERKNRREYWAYFEKCEAFESVSVSTTK